MDLSGTRLRVTGGGGSQVLGSRSSSNEGGAAPIVIRFPDDGPTVHRRVHGAHEDAYAGYVIRASLVLTFIRKCVETKVGGEDEVVLWGTGRQTRESLHGDDDRARIGNRTRGS